jgi:hypothetical protein
VKNYNIKLASNELIMLIDVLDDWFLEHFETNVDYDEVKKIREIIDACVGCKEIQKIRDNMK